MFQEIPLRSDIAQYGFNFDILGRSFRFDLSWNVREARWYVSISSDETPILLGRPILVNYNMFAQFQRPELADFKLIFFDTSGQSLDPMRFDLGSRVILYLDTGE